MARSTPDAYPELRLILVSKPGENGRSATPLLAEAMVPQKPFRLDTLAAKVRAFLDAGSFQ